MNLMFNKIYFSSSYPNSVITEMCLSSKCHTLIWAILINGIKQHFSPLRNQFSTDFRFLKLIGSSN